jgi:acyl-CoA thioesterase-1
MKRPIRFEERKAAQGGLYFLRLACASWLLLCLACGAEDPVQGGTAAATGPLPGSSGPTEFAASSQSTVTRSLEESLPVVVFLGTSLTAGYGLPEDEAFPALIQQKIDASGLGFRVVNAGVSGDTSAGGLRRLAWLLRLPVSVLVLELGANDMLRGQSVDALQQNLESILDRTLEAHPHARFLIAGMRAAPNLGKSYGAAFDATYPALAERYDAGFVPFLLEDVAAKRRLNQADGIHPTAEGHALIAERVWTQLEPIIRATPHD